MNSIILGLVVSLVLGSVLTPLFLKVSYWVVSKKLSRPESPLGIGDWHPYSIIFGIVERLFFTIIVAYDVSGAAISMVAWLGAKMAAYWNKTTVEDDNRISSLISLLAGLFSMLFALVGGIMVKNGI